MSYALITGGGTDGRYTIQLDWGAATKTAALAALETIRVANELSIATQQAIVDAGTASEVAQAQALSNLVEQYIASEAALPPELQGKSGDAFRPLYDQELKKLYAMRAAHAPNRIALDSIKNKQKEVMRLIAYWNAFVATETREAWCVDFDEDATGYVGTLDINGESELLLIAPGGRAWNAGDGTMLASRKTEKLASIDAKLTAVNAQLATVEAQITAAEAEKVTLTTARNSAQGTFIAVPTAANQSALEAASLALSDKNREIIDLKARRSGLNAQAFDLTQRQTYWTSRAASATPDYGDGVLVAREIMSPEQAYFNAAILPGWQKDMPNYRWGTLTSIDRDANTANVSLSAATSSAQSLSINQTSTLSNVPFEYLDCHHEPFVVGDNVVVKFNSMNWANPTIIGYLDNPQPCGYLLEYEEIKRSFISDGLLPDTPDPAAPSINRQRVAEGNTAPTVTAASCESILGLFFRGWNRLSSFDGADGYYTQLRAISQTNVTGPDTWQAIYRSFGPRMRKSASWSTAGGVIVPGTLKLNVGTVGLSLGLASDDEEQAFRWDGATPSGGSPTSDTWYVDGIPGTLTGRCFFGSAAHSVDVVTTWTHTSSVSTGANSSDETYTLATQSHYSIPA